MKPFRLVITILAIAVLVVVGAKLFFKSSAPAITITKETTKTNSSNISFVDKKVSKYIYQIKVSNKSSSKEANLDLSSLGWDVVPVSDQIFQEGHLFYEPANNLIIVPLVVAPDTLPAGGKPAGTLPNPPFKTAVFTTPLTDSAILTQQYATNDFYADHSVYNPKNKQLYLSEVISAGFQDKDSKEIIWAVDTKTWEKTKIAEVIIPNYNAIFMGMSLYRDWETDRKSTRLNSSHSRASRMPSSA